MITILLASGLPVTVILTAPLLFRHWRRAESFTIYDRQCRHGYQVLDRGKPCHGRSPLKDWALCGISLGAALLFPLALVVAFIMYKPPQSDRELQAHIRDLEKELGMR